ncbi:putative ribosomal N-acetyltransferase YdaF [compost metagenome]|uniref:GNAT family N-acetyltransferase n=1 Tax=Janthinobacterium sp. AD80 TaxID=1528773 RepID=UPI000C84A335|nr:GNAT family protein [Janthinobacterium sp. AD80]PMQ08061.1 putative ribosomal N-acetyltransferase YdaF [Janthinobacterium sp. AD80]
MLKGTLCTVRHVQAADLNNYIALVNDLPSRGEFFSMQFKSPEVIRREFMQTGLVTEDSELFLIEDQHQHIIGTITHFKSRTPASREIGYRLFDPQRGGRGYTSEATRLLVDYLFHAYTYHRLELLMDPQNTASERIAQKNGFTQEGLMRQAFFINGSMRDVKMYSLLRPEWQARSR